MTALKTLNTHNSLFFFPKYSTMTKFPGISSLLTQAPQNHINTFESESTRSYKTGGKRERRRFDFRGRAKIVRTDNVFRAPHTSLEALQIG